ncbi:hypothetical protein OK074_7222 [Actinobacteria bacterium OK074]|nr:hypothetical protein OK074_7222 [Actinobacteria bacterium OK074]
MSDTESIEEPVVDETQKTVTDPDNVHITGAETDETIVKPDNVHITAVAETGTVTADNVHITDETS